MKMWTSDVATKEVSCSKRGFTLIEVLITLLVTSVGLLAMAALQLSSMRNNLDSAIRTQASILANDIVERMRANRLAATSNSAYNTALTDPAPSQPTTRAEIDIADWKNTLATQIPGAQGSVQYNAVSKLVTVEVSWTERGTESSPTPQSLSFSSTTQL